MKRRSPALATRARRLALRTTTHLVQVHPVPRAPREAVNVAVHLMCTSAAAQRKAIPGLSEDAALLLAARPWELRELAARLWRAVENNRGSLITAADLLDI